jgi:signal transduction histidine kinase
MSLTFERKLPIVLTFIFFVLTTVGIISYQGTVSIREELSRQERTRRVLESLDNVLTDSVQTDTAVMSFVITGDETYLAEKDAADKRTVAEMTKLDADTAADPEQDIEFDKLQSLVNRHDQVVKNLIELRKRTDFQTAIAQLPLSSSTAVGNQLRQSIDHLKGRELVLLRSHEDATDHNMNRTILILLISSLAGIAALVLANFIVLIENNRRRSAERGLIRANEELEEKVKTRTSELEKANRNLLTSAGEREELLAKEQAARREAEIANRLRDEFMATVSHELRTPLNSILGWARLLNNGNLEPRQSAKAIRTIIKNSESQNRLIEDLLDVARMISGKLQLEVTDVPIKEFIEHSIETARPEAAKRDITISLDLDDSLVGRSIAGDRVRLEQVVGNLLTNALKFSRPENSVEVAAFAEDGFMNIQVTDHGAGINAEFLPLVFERFRQDRSTIKQSGGLGLGLAVVRNLAELHGGSVSAASEGENKGSTFTVRLPIADQSAS